MQRIKQLQDWLRNSVGISEFECEPASSDASFRRYFRITPKSKLPQDLSGETSLIVMDAPPDKEDTTPFINISKILADIGLNVPIIKQQQAEDGYLLLTDLGAQQYLPNLHADNVESMYGDALNALLQMQKLGPRSTEVLPAYDYELLMQEMSLFDTWYLREHLSVDLNEQQQAILNNAYEALAQSALEQPQVCVHRDYHSRNLMLTQRNNPGVLDFQDAVIGAVSYDLVSLLRDCYVKWPQQQVESWAINYLKRAAQEGVMESVEEKTALRWFDWMGVQRHLKASGIFARLNHRDGKPGYLDDIPRTLSYVLDVSNRYPELTDFNELLLSVLPKSVSEKTV